MNKSIGGGLVIGAVVWAIIGAINGGFRGAVVLGIAGAMVGAIGGAVKGKADVARKRRVVFPAPELKQWLLQLASKLPQLSWSALVDSNGRVIESHLVEPDMTSDRITWVVTALLPLGQRICKELGSGMHYSILASEKSLQLIMALNKGRWLALGLSRDVSIDQILNTIRELMLLDDQRTGGLDSQ
jgi:predicted regulator of Ras-like GTPase activity (Roadblock/LC7/MglB family)